MNVPALQDPIRMLVYEWIIGAIGERRGKLLDIGCRDSGFPAYMAGLGNDVTGCERMKGFEKEQEAWQKRFKGFNFINDDLLSLDGKYNFITSIFALQHNSDNDMDKKCYEHCAKLLEKGGSIFISHEYSSEGGWVQRGRNDGDLRGYNWLEAYERMISPIVSILGSAEKTIKYMRWDGLNARWCEEKEAMTICVEIKSL